MRVLKLFIRIGQLKILRNNPESLTFLISFINLILSIAIVKLSFYIFSDLDLILLNDFLILTSFTNVFLTLSAQNYFLTSTTNISLHEINNYYMFIICISFALFFIFKHPSLLGISFSILASFLILKGLDSFQKKSYFLFLFFSVFLNFLIILLFFVSDSIEYVRIYLPVILLFIIFIANFRPFNPSPFIKYGLKLVPYSILSYVLFNFIRFNEFIFESTSYVVFYLAFITLFTVSNLVSDTFQRYFMLRYKRDKQISSQYYYVLLLSLIVSMVLFYADTSAFYTYLSQIIFTRKIDDQNLLFNSLILIFNLRLMLIFFLIPLHYNRKILVINTTLILAIFLGCIFSYLFFTFDKIFLIKLLNSIFIFYALSLLSYYFMDKKIYSS